MNLLALDISKRATGVAVGDGSRPPASFVKGWPGLQRGPLGVAFREFLLDLIALHAPRMVVFEAPIVQGVAASLDDARIKLGLAFMVEAVCAKKGVRCFDVHVQSARSVVLGKGRPSNPKEAVVAFCRGVGWDVGDSHDRADAAVTWAYGHLRYGNKSGVTGLLSRASVAAMRGR